MTDYHDDISKIPSINQFLPECHRLANAVAVGVFDTIDGPIVISTVVLITGHSFLDGFFKIIETRVIGGKLDGETRSFQTHGIDSDVNKLAIEQHNKLTIEVLKSNQGE